MNSVVRKYLEFLHPDAPRPRSCDRPPENVINAMIEKGLIIAIRDYGYPLSRDYAITSTGLVELAKQQQAAAALVREFNRWTPMGGTRFRDG